jgi:hypothetical protein
MILRINLTIVFIITLAVMGSATDHPKIFIWDNDIGGVFPNPDNQSQNIGTEVNLRAALLANGYTDITMSTTMPYDLSQYTVVFVLDGMFPYTGTITDNYQNVLVDYLANKNGRLYIEGGDFGYNYRNGPLFSYLGAAFSYDGFPYQTGNVHHAVGAPNSFANGLTLTYPGYKTNKSDNYLDEIDTDLDPLTDSFLVFSSDTMFHASNGRCVAYHNTVDPNDYHTIYSTFIFSGLQNGAGNNTRNHLMSLYMDFFEWTIGVEPTTLGNIKALYR